MRCVCTLQAFFVFRLARGLEPCLMLVWPRDKYRTVTLPLHCGWLHR
jgi:hypothetical protein